MSKGTHNWLANQFLCSLLAREIGYAMLPSERGKGYCSEAVKIMVDYLFLSRDLVRIQATTDVNNLASQRVLEKAGFKKEGTIRKSAFIRGEWRDSCLFSDRSRDRILRECARFY